MINELNLQVDGFESEVESISSAKRKKDKDVSVKYNNIKKIYNWETLSLACCSLNL